MSVSQWVFISIFKKHRFIFNKSILKTNIFY
jgi:hypothetical protein